MEEQPLSIAERLAELETLAQQFERLQRAATAERKRGREDSEDSLRNKANQQAQIIIGRMRRLAGVLRHEAEQKERG